MKILELAAVPARRVEARCGALTPSRKCAKRGESGKLRAVLLAIDDTRLGRAIAYRRQIARMADDTPKLVGGTPGGRLATQARYSGDELSLSHGRY